MMKEILLGGLLVLGGMGLTVSGCGGSGTSSSDGKDQKLAGVWMGLYSPDGNATSFEERYLIMNPDGTFYHDMPLQGLDGFDINSVRDTDNWGTYTFDGSKGTWKYQRTVGEATALSMEDGKLKIGMDTYFRCTQVDDLLLKGAWTTYADPKDPDLKQEGELPIITFTTDGKFVDQGLFAQGFQALLSDEDQTRSAPGQGSYTVKNYTLTLKYDDGRVRKAAFSLYFSATRQNSPDRILIYRTGLNLIPGTSRNYLK